MSMPIQSGGVTATLRSRSLLRVVNISLLVVVVVALVFYISPGGGESRFSEYRPTWPSFLGSVSGKNGSLAEKLDSQGGEVSISQAVSVAWATSTSWAHATVWTTKTAWTTATPRPVPVQDPTQQQTEGGENDDQTDEDPRCLAFPDMGDIVIAVKTGATEAHRKIPTQMLTSLRCAKNLMIFSDLEQDVAGYHLHDSLDKIPESAMKGNSDFDLYRRLKEWAKYGQIEVMLASMADPRRPETNAAWTLDKYKQLHILEKLWNAYPDRKWYIMIDADTYLSWPNLNLWLRTFADPLKRKLFIGNNGASFAHGGSGILQSGGALRDFVVTHNGSAAEWDVPMRNECCGDYIISQVYKKNGVRLIGATPTLIGENPATLPFGPERWCQPVATMHHVDPGQMSLIYEYEKSRPNQTKPWTFADFFKAVILGNLPKELDNWDNQSINRGNLNQKSFDDCSRLCEKDERCFQWSWDGRKCNLGFSFHLGERHIKNDEEIEEEKKTGKKFSRIYKSGWKLDRIEAWVKSQPPCDIYWPEA